MAPKMEPGGATTKKLELSWRAGASPPERVRGDPKIYPFFALDSGPLARDPFFYDLERLTKTKCRTVPKDLQKGEALRRDWDSNFTKKTGPGTPMGPQGGPKASQGDLLTDC